MKNFRLLIFLLLTGTFSNSFSQAVKTNSMANEKQDSIYVVDLKAVDYAFAMPAEIPSGWITFRMENMGEMTHYALIEKVKEGISMDSIRYKLYSGLDIPAKVVGGPGYHSSGQKSDITIQLDSGNYLMQCFAKTPEGKTHAELGMKMAFRVMDKPSGAKKPEPDTRISLEKYNSSRDKTIASGRQIVEFIHEDYPLDFHLVRANDSSDIMKALVFMDDLQDPSLVEWLTGVEQAAAGTSSFMTYDFEPGNYAFISQEYGLWGVTDMFTIEEGDDVNRPVNKRSIDANPVKLELIEHRFQVSGSPKSGANTFLFTPKEDKEHEVLLMRLEKGKNKDDLIGFFKSSKEDHRQGHHNHPPRPMRGYPIIFEQKSSYEATVDLFPGKYAVLCFEEEDEKPHFEMGEIKEFVVE